MKTFKLLAVSAFALALAPAFTSCKGDDAPQEPNGSEASVIDGTHLTSIDNCHIGYDKHNRPVSFTNSYDEDDVISIDYSANKIYFDEGELDVKFNNKGFITEMSSSWDLKEEVDGETYHYKGSGKLTFSYDKNNCLTSMKENSSETEKYSGSKETYKYSRDSKIDFTWNNGKLVKMYCQEKEEEDGEKDEERYNVDIEYSDDVNAYKQFPLSIIYATDVELDVLFSVGLFGNGPAYLPDYLTVNYEDDDEESYSISFSINENGSLNTEKVGYKTWQYGYSDITRAFGMTGNEKPLNSIKRMFRHFDRKK